MAIESKMLDKHHDEELDRGEALFASETLPQTVHMCESFQGEVCGSAWIGLVRRRPG